MDEPTSCSVVEAVKDLESPHPVATVWRQAFRRVVSSFVQGDFLLEGCDPHVVPLDVELARQLRDYVASYGERLAELPEECWLTSTSQWVGSHWDVVVDLWTVESGRSDMVLDARVLENGFKFSIEVILVYVP